MANATKTFSLLTRLEQIDVEEDRVLDELLRLGGALEESERRGRMVTVAELRALRDGLGGLEQAIDVLQAGIARAELAAKGPEAGVGNGHASGYGDGQAHATPAKAKGPPYAPAAPPASPPAPSAEPPPTFDELAACVREHDAEGARLRRLLRERFAALEHVAPPSDAPRTLRVTTPPMTGGDVQALQVALEHRFERWEIGLHVDTNGIYDEATRLAARRVARGLGIASEDLAHGITPELRRLIRNPSGRTAEQLKRARENGAWLKALRKRYPVGGHHRGNGHASQPRRAPAAGKRVAPAAPAHRSSGGVEAAIRAHGGRHEDIIVREARAQGVPVSLVCAVIEHESSFANVFGHDPVRNPIKSPHGGLLAVTEERYREYLRHRNRGEGAQGVGPMQLTLPAFQDRADELGGCWKVGPNIKVGVGEIARLTKAYGMRNGMRRYNGSGSRAEKYADDIVKAELRWRGWLKGLASSAGGGAPKPHVPSGPHAPRVYKVTATPMSGTDVKAFQELLNMRMERWDIDLRIEQDGVYGTRTKDMARRVARGLGIEPEAYAHGITPAVRSLIRNPTRRTPAQLERARRNRPWRLALKKRYAVAGGGAGSSGGHYPLARRGKFNGGPYVGSHRKGNWQSDNAVDLNVPVGTPILSVDDGVVVKVYPHPQDGSGFAGDQITIRGDHGNSFFYTHGHASVKAGRRVRRGQVIGTSGSAAGVAHLHFAVEKGDPRQIIGQWK